MTPSVPSCPFAAVSPPSPSPFPPRSCFPVTTVSLRIEFCVNGILPHVVFRDKPCSRCFSGSSVLLCVSVATYFIVCFLLSAPDPGLYERHVGAFMPPSSCSSTCLGHFKPAGSLSLPLSKLLPPPGSWFPTPACWLGRLCTTKLGPPCIRQPLLPSSPGPACCSCLPTSGWLWIPFSVPQEPFSLSSSELPHPGTLCYLISLSSCLLLPAIPFVPQSNIFPWEDIGGISKFCTGQKNLCLSGFLPSPPSFHLAFSFSSRQSVSLFLMPSACSLFSGLRSPHSPPFCSGLPSILRHHHLLSLCSPFLVHCLPSPSVLRASFLPSLGPIPLPLLFSLPSFFGYVVQHRGS